MNEERELRCFWMRIRKPPPEVEPRVFVALCDGALHSGLPEDCTCDTWPERLARLQAEIGRERRRAAEAEAALVRVRARVSANMDAFLRWRRAAEERIRRRAAASDT